MAALSADTTLPLATQARPRQRPYVIKNSQAMYRRALCGLDADGVLIPWADSALALRWKGIFDNWDRAGVTAGNTSATPAIRGIVDVGGPMLYGVDVAGVSTRASIGEPVYAPTDNYADLTLTPTAFVKPIGVLDDFRTTSDMDVRLFTPEEYHAYGSFSLLTFQILLASIANGDILTTITPGVRGRIVKWYAAVSAAATTAAKATTLNLEVGTTDLTGGTLALTSANMTPLGAVVAQGTAFSAGMAFGAADTISIEAASTTAFVEGAINLHILLQLDE